MCERTQTNNKARPHLGASLIVPEQVTETVVPLKETVVIQFNRPPKRWPGEEAAEAGTEMLALAARLSCIPDEMKGSPLPF